MEAWDSIEGNDQVVVKASREDWRQVLGELRSINLGTEAGDDLIMHLEHLRVDE